MRVLLDECLPRRLKRDLVGHDVRTAPEMRWASKKNGELLALAATWHSQRSAPQRLAQASVTTAIWHGTKKSLQQTMMWCLFERSERHTITLDHLNQLFYKDGGEIKPLYEDLKTTRMADAFRH